MLVIIVRIPVIPHILYDDACTERLERNAALLAVKFSIFTVLSCMNSKIWRISVKIHIPKVKY